VTYEGKAGEEGGCETHCAGRWDPIGVLEECGSIERCPREIFIL